MRSDPSVVSRARRLWISVSESLIYESCHDTLPTSESMIDHRLMNGRAVRDRILAGIAERVAIASAKHPIGRLLSVSIGENKAAAVYVRGQASAAKKVGLRFDQQIWPSDLRQDE